MSEKMKAAVITDVKTIEFQEFDIPKIDKNEVLYKLKSVSLCTVEQRGYSGAKFFGFPLLGGHETSGVVVEVGEDVKDFKVGDRVISTFNYCGECDFCKLGQGTQCKYGLKGKKRVKEFPGTIIGGGLAQYLAVQTNQLVKVENEADFDHLALTEPLACCVHSVEKGKIRFGDTVVVIGAGIMGLLQAKLSLLQGAHVIISDPDAARLEKAKALGVHNVIDPSKVDAVETVKELTNGKGADVVFNTIPFTAIWHDAMAMLAPYGRLIAYSSQDEPEDVPISFEKLHNKEYEYIGTVSPTIADNVRATRLIANGIINMEDFIDSRYAYEDVDEAFKRAITPNTYRVVIHVDSER